MSSRGNDEKMAGKTPGNPALGSGSREGPGNPANGERSRMGMIQMNDLVYKLEPDLSVASNRTYKDQFFQSTQYTDTQTAISIWNSGADYIDTRRSFLTFAVTQDFKMPNGVDAAVGGFGMNGTILNIIDQITISSRSGDELGRIYDHNQLCSMLMPYMYDENWKNSTGQLLGWGDGAYPTGHTLGARQFVLPLYCLHPLFAYGRLLPAMLTSGLRIEIRWARPSKAFVVGDVGGAVGGTADTYSVVDPIFRLCSVQLSDAIQRTLNEFSAVNGLELVYCDYERTTGVLGNNADAINTEVRKSASRALKAFARIVDTGDSLTVDNFASTYGFGWSEYQWQVGSLYFPQQVARSKLPAAETALDLGPLAFSYTLEAFDKFHAKASHPMISLSRYIDNGDSVLTAQSDGKQASLHNQPVVYTKAEVTNGGNNVTYDAPTATVVIVNNAGDNTVGRYHVGDFFEPTSGVNAGHVHEIVAIVTDTAANVTLRLKPAPSTVGAAASNFQIIRNFRLGVTPTLAASRGLGANYISPYGKIGTYLNGATTIGVTLERSTLFNLSGIPVNNSRVLLLRAKAKAETYQRTLFIYLKYVKLCRVFLNNVEVEQ